MSIFLGLVFSLTGQITLTNNDMPSAGDTIRKSTGLNIDFTDPEETGEDYTWDFSQLIPIVQSVDTFVKVTDTPLFYWLFYLTSANLASPVIADSPIPEIPLTDVYQFYNNSSDKYEDVGFAATLFSIPIPLKYDDPDLLYDFPMNYGDEFSSTSVFELGLEDVGYIYVERQRANTVDGWGTLITPYGTFDVLRVKSEVTEYDSIYLDSLEIGIPVNIEYIEYKWMGKGQKIPLLKITDNLLSFVVEYRDSLRTESTDIEDPVLINEDYLSIYPNPASAYLNISGFEPGTEGELHIYNLEGRLVYSSKVGGELPGNPGLRIDLNAIGIKSGQYIFQLTTDNKKLSKRFVYLP